MPKKIFIFSLILCVNSVLGFSQTSEDSSLETAVNIYKNVVGVNTHLYIGYAYTDFNRAIIGNPFFMDTLFSSGSINYNGFNYSDVKMFYDILNDNVVISAFDSSRQIILLNEKITGFQLLGHTFIKTTAGDNADLKNKFFDVLYNGTAKVLVRRKKIVDEKMRTTLESVRNFVEYDTYFVLNKNKYYKINNLDNLLDAFHDHKKEIQKYIKAEKLKFRTGKENLIKQVAEYYDSFNTAK